MALCFELTEEQELLRKTVRDFAEKEIAPVARELDEKEEFSYELTKKMGDLGLFGMFVAEKYGGSNVGYLSYIIAVEEVARVDGSQAATIAAGNSLGIAPIYYFGNEEQKKKWLPGLCRGEILAGFGLTEPNAGSDAGASRTTATLEGNEWVINGSKIFITNASTEISKVVTVQAVTGKRPDGKNELSCILVTKGSPGFIQKPMRGKMMWRASNTSELYFENCRVPAENLLGAEGMGFHIMMKTLDFARPGIAGQALGIAAGAFEYALAYAKERVAFGQPVFNFQGVSFKLAEMCTRVEAARHLLYKTCAAYQEQPKDMSRLTPELIRLSAMAKCFCSDVAMWVTTEAVQVLGGYGYTREFPVERMMRDAKITQIYEGTNEIQRLVIANTLK